jgi:hypothetical protein
MNNQQCGCYIARVGNYGQEIVYCSLHDAAPRMLEVLKDELSAIRIWRQAFVPKFDCIFEDVLSGFNISESKIEIVIAKADSF